MSCPAKENSDELQAGYADCYKTSKGKTNGTIHN